MKKNFKTIMDHVFQWEGGYVDHPRDPGGATNMGITIHTMKALKQDLDNDGDVDKDDVRLVTRPVAEAIYKSMYWKPVKADLLPSGLDLVLVDAAINSGPRASVRWLQRALGVSPDGALGPITLGAVQASESVYERPSSMGQFKSLEQLIDKTIDERLKSVRSFRNYDVFGKGWENRIASVLHRAQELAKNG